RRPHALARHAQAAAVAAHHQAVVAADDAAVGADAAERERRAAVRAEVLERGDGAVLAAEEDHAVAANRAAERCAGDLVGGAGDVPGVANVHAASLPAADSGAYAAYTAGGAVMPATAGRARRRRRALAVSAACRLACLDGRLGRLRHLQVILEGRQRLRGERLDVAVLARVRFLFEVGDVLLVVGDHV